MSAVLPRRRAAWCLAGALLLAGCGEQAATRGGGAAQGSFLPDTAPWSVTPAPEIWELASWVPAGERSSARRVAPEFLRKHGALLRTQSVWFDTVRAWQRWVGELELGRDGFADVIVVTEPVQFMAYLPHQKESEIVARLLKQGFREQALAGMRTFVAPEAETAVAAWIDGRLVLGDGDPATFERLAALRAGREPSVRTSPGVEAAAAAVGPGLPVEIRTAQAGIRGGPPGAPPVLADLSRHEATAEGPREISALALRAEADVAQMRTTLDALLAALPISPADRPLLASRGAVLRLTNSSRLQHIGGSRDSGIHNDLGALGQALERFRGIRGALPTAQEGLAALGSVAGCLDDFLDVLPSDPWGRPYAYQPDHPRRPGSYVLRSLGPDGEIDTEDDVLPDR